MKKIEKDDKQLHTELAKKWLIPITLQPDNYKLLLMLLYIVIIIITLFLKKFNSTFFELGIKTIHNKNTTREMAKTFNRIKKQ